MRKSLQLLSLIFVVLLAIAAARILPRLPADAQPYVEKKYAGWNGVLRGWIASDWSCGGGFVRWLNACAAEFEKQHDGVYLEFTEVTGSAMREMGGSGIRLPELVLFSPGVLTDAGGLLAIDAPAGLAPNLAACGAGRALPVAMGGYIWVYNRALCDGAPQTAAEAVPLTLPPDGAGRSFTAAAIALLSGDPGAPEAELELPEAGLDLGLPASAATDAEVLVPAEDALDRFIDGEIPATVATQRELARLIRLRDAGKGPDWACAATGDWACADQLLMLGVVAQDGADGAERAALAAEFAAWLLRDESQQKLADVGAFPATNVRAHSDFSAYAPMETLLRSRALLVPDVFSEHSGADGAEIARDFLSGRLSAEDALRSAGWIGLGYGKET